ncbi:hypothetical protein [Variovorax sp. 54]|uniref:hypothetical protein n=1 Tax=Variovorax sp. 54 TaxID=2035212 RepID=UPI00117D446B|nr:hypothetical protein [Variovorax sp. 54]
MAIQKARKRVTRFGIFDMSAAPVQKTNRAGHGPAFVIFDDGGDGDGKTEFLRPRRNGAPHNPTIGHTGDITKRMFALLRHTSRMRINHIEASSPSMRSFRGRP